jgi:hypothetical protein
MWNEFNLKMSVDRLVGGIPRHPEIVKRWQEARWGKPLPTDPQTPDEAAAITVENLGNQAMSDEEKAAIWTGFAEKDGYLVIESRQVKAMLKESANIVKPLVPDTRGKTIPLRSRVAERVFVHPHFLSLGVAQPTGTIERPIHVMTAQGPRTALKRTDYVDNPVIECTLRVLDDGMITEKILRFILDHASENGLGTDRSQGAGTFTYELS